MHNPPPSPSIDDLSNRWLVHPAARRLVPLAIRRGVSANTVSIAGLACGFLAALAYSRWWDGAWAVAGFLLMIGWHICDGMDGMIARATKSASEAGRLLDGLCDYTTFILVYMVLAATLPWDEPIETYWAAMAAGAVHAIQSALYEGARERHFRRLRGEQAQPWQASRFGGALERLYVGVNQWAGAPTRVVDEVLAAPGLNAALRDRYVQAAVPWLRFMTLLSANGRTLAIFLACLAGSPAYFWWWEVAVLTPITAIGLIGLRRTDSRLVQKFAPQASAAG